MMAESKENEELASFLHEGCSFAEVCLQEKHPVSKHLPHRESLCRWRQRVPISISPGQKALDSLVLKKGRESQEDRLDCTWSTHVNVLLDRLLSPLSEGQPHCLKGGAA